MQKTQSEPLKQIEHSFIVPQSLSKKIYQYKVCMQSPFKNIQKFVYKALLLHSPCLYTLCQTQRSEQSKHRNQKENRWQIKFWFYCSSKIYPDVLLPSQLFVRHTEQRWEQKWRSEIHCGLIVEKWQNMLWNK